MSEPQTFQCSGCHQDKTASDFHSNRSTKTGLNCYCKTCSNAKRRSYYVKTGRQPRENKGRPPDYHKHYMWLARYGLTPDQVAQMAVDQDDRCAICREPLPLVIDHDHKSGEVRGLLCAACNTGLGHIERPGFVVAALGYLMQFDPEVAEIVGDLFFEALSHSGPDGASLLHRTGYM